MFWIEPDCSESAGKLGQVILFLTFLVNVAVQFYRERNARIERMQDKVDAAGRETRIKDALQLQHNETRRQVAERLNSVWARFNKLVDDEEENEKRDRPK
jgi:F0F1-type ATP synthase membrane subunit b/b'